MYKNEQLSQGSRSSNDEIDLFEVFNLLWRGRTTILLIAGCVTLFALAYAFAAPQKWTSIAYVIAPKVEDISPYLSRRRVLAWVEKDQSVDAAAFASRLFDEFIELSATPIHKQSFLAKTKDFQDRAEGMDELQAAALLERLANTTPLVSAPQKNQIVPYYKISYTADNAYEAQQGLKEYIDYVNKQALQQSDAAFGDNLKAGIQERKSKLAEIEFGVRTLHEGQITTVETALYTAKQAGVTDYAAGRAIPGNTVIEFRGVDRLFMLGETYLNAELQALREKPLVYPPRYHETKYELQQLEALGNYQLTPSLSYRFQLSPTYPTSRESPKRMLIIVLGVLLGGMLGCFWVLIWSIARRQPAEAR